MEGNSGVSAGKYADRKWRGFNEERWAVWKDGLRAARENDRANGVVQEASDRMERL